MGETMRATVLHVVPPEKLPEHDLEPELERLADSRYVLVCRVGGRPSILDRLASFFLRRPIEAVTLVTDDAAQEGAEVTATVTETGLTGVYEASRLEAN